MAVILSDGEAEDIASILRRMAERVEDGPGTMAYVDNRGPGDFANQLEALVDADDPTVYLPIAFTSDGPKPIAAFVSRNSAAIHAQNVGGVASIESAPLRDPDEPIGGEPVVLP